MAAPSFSYEAVAEHPEQVRQELCRLWGYNLSPSDSAEDKFRWLYRDAPQKAETVFIVRAKGADGGERIVGTNGLAVRRYQVGRGNDALVGISADLAVDPEHRALLPALRLLGAVRAFVSANFAFAYGYPNKKAEPVMQRAGFDVLGTTTRYARVLRHEHYASRLGERDGIPDVVVRAAKDPRIGTIAGRLFDLARLALDGIDVARAAARHRFDWAERFDPRFDALWEAARPDYDIVGARTATFLGWRYPSCEIATLVRRSDETLRAYAVIQREPETGGAEVRDLFGHADDLGTLIDLLLPALWLRAAVSVSVRFVGAPRVASLLVARGFELREGGRNVRLTIGNSDEGDRLKDASRWHLFNVDEDA